MMCSVNCDDCYAKNHCDVVPNSMNCQEAREDAEKEQRIRADERNKTIEEIIDSVDKMNNSGSHCVEDYCEDADSCSDCIAKAILRMLEQMKGEQK